MRLSDFFTEEQDPNWGMNGEPWTSWRVVLDSELIERMRRGPLPDRPDWTVAQGLSRLAHRELEAYGTGRKGEALENEEVIEVLRALRSVLGRLNIEFKPPFRDYGGFHAYWVKQDMSYNYAARRGYLSDLFTPVWDRLDELEEANSGPAGIHGVDGQMKNIIFASCYKPEIVLRDAINNVIEVVTHADTCLFYDRELTTAGLTWGELIAWWRERQGLSDSSDRVVGHDLYRRLCRSIGNNPAELLVFNAYCTRYRGETGLRRPALLPQVYLHYDPLTRRERRTLGKDDRLKRERMDFLLMLPGGGRIVIEVDGKQHYAQGDIASPRFYSEMMAEDRTLRLKGYEVYRFGGYELTENPNATAMLGRFFDDLDARHGTGNLS